MNELKETKNSPLNQNHIRSQIHAYLVERGPGEQKIKYAKNYHEEFLTEYSRGGSCKGIALLLLAAEMETVRLTNKVTDSTFTIPETEVAREEKKHATTHHLIPLEKDIHNAATLLDYFEKVAAWDRTKASLTPQTVAALSVKILL